MLRHKAQLRVRVIQQFPGQALLLLALDQQPQWLLVSTGLVQGRAQSVGFQTGGVPQGAAELFQEARLGDGLRLAGRVVELVVELLRQARELGLTLGLQVRGDDAVMRHST